MKCTGLTFEDIEDATYQETYSYQSDPDNSDNTIYNAYLYKSPGVLYWIRQKAHAWGVQKLNNIIEKDVKEERDKILFAIKERAQVARMKVQASLEAKKAVIQQKKETLK